MAVSLVGEASSHKFFLSILLVQINVVRISQNETYPLTISSVPDLHARIRHLSGEILEKQGDDLGGLYIDRDRVSILRLKVGVEELFKSSLEWLRLAANHEKCSSLACSLSFYVSGNTVSYIYNLLQPCVAVSI